MVVADIGSCARLSKRKRMEQELIVKLIWKDADIVEARMSAWNGQFGGTVDMYLGYGVLGEFAEALDGFPRTAGDKRDFQLGDLDNDGSGGALLSLHTVDLAGHIAATLTLVTGTRLGPNQEVTLQSSIEAAAVDRFVSELWTMCDEVGSVALLRFNS